MYRFQLPPLVDGPSFTRSVFVQSPKTPGGRLRAGLGLWRYRGSQERGTTPRWLMAANIETVAGWICRQAEWAHLKER